VASLLGKFLWSFLFPNPILVRGWVAYTNQGLTADFFFKTAIDMMIDDAPNYPINYEPVVVVLGLLLLIQVRI